jgi:steroid 5-alpha reductase family enzyme
MGYIVLAFYNCAYVQNLVAAKGATGPLMFVVLLVGVQGVAELLVSGVLGGVVARAVAKYAR